LAALYFDSEMFGRSGKNRKYVDDINSEKNKNRDYKKEFVDYLNDDRNFPTPHSQDIRKWYRRRMIGLLKYETENDDWRKLLEAIKKGDTKLRSGRAITRNMKSKYNKKARGK
jgi:hypothetical protein